MSIKIKVILMAAMLLLGCTSGPVLLNHGDAMAHNKTAQRVNQTIAVATQAPELDGPKSQQVMETYRTDTGKAENKQILVNISSGGD